MRSNRINSSDSVALKRWGALLLRSVYELCPLSHEMLEFLANNKASFLALCFITHSCGVRCLSGWNRLVILGDILRLAALTGLQFEACVVAIAAIASNQLTWIWPRLPV